MGHIVMATNLLLSNNSISNRSLEKHVATINTEVAAMATVRELRCDRTTAALADLVLTAGNLSFLAVACRQVDHFGFAISTRHYMYQQTLWSKYRLCESFFMNKLYETTKIKYCVHMCNNILCKHLCPTRVLF